MGPPPRSAWRLELRGVNAYLVDDGDLTLVDAGTPWDVERVRRSLSIAGYTPADVDRVLLTHYDLDHVGTLAALDVDGPHYLADPDAGFLDGSARPPVGNHKGLLQRATGRLLDRPAVPIERVDDGDTIGGFTAVRAPGHTPGHTVYLHEEYDIAFLGDLVRGDGGALAPSPWLVTYDTDENERSVRDVAARLPAFDVAAPGHGDPVRTNGYGALRRLADRL